MNRSGPNATGALLACLLLLSYDLSALGPGDTATGFELPTLRNGQLMTLADFRGKVIYIDFWASWCGPCRKSLPLYEAMRTEYPQERFEIVAINLDEDREAAVRFLDKNPVSYTVLMDPGGVVASQWQIPAMPSSFLLDQQGWVINAWAGFQPSHLEEIQNEIRRALD